MLPFSFIEHFGLHIFKIFFLANHLLKLHDIKERMHMWMGTITHHLSSIILLMRVLVVDLYIHKSQVIISVNVFPLKFSPNFSNWCVKITINLPLTSMSMNTSFLYAWRCFWWLSLSLTMSYNTFECHDNLYRNLFSLNYIDWYICKVYP